MVSDVFHDQFSLSAVSLVNDLGKTEETIHVNPEISSDLQHSKSHVSPSESVE